MSKDFLSAVSAVIVAFLVFTTFVYFTDNTQLSTNNRQQMVKGISDPVISVDIGDKYIKTAIGSREITNGLIDVVKNKSGVYGIYIKNVKSGAEYGINIDEKYFSASLYKIPVAISVYKAIEEKKIGFGDAVTYTDRHNYPGSGVIKNFDYGKKYSVETLLRMLIKNSDNVAQSMLLSKVGNAISKEIMPDVNSVTPKSVSKIIEDLYLGKHLDKISTSLLLNLMTNTSFDNRIHEGLPENLTFAHKIGSWQRTGSWHDCGIILEKELIICVMSKNTTYEEFLRVAEETGSLIEIM